MVPHLLELLSDHERSKVPGGELVLLPVELRRA